MTAKSCVKLGDFGISRVLERTQDKAKSIVGTPYYLSPEIIQSKPYSYEADVWSLGVLLYEMCTLKPPFDSTSLTGLAAKIVKGSYTPIPSKYSEELKALVDLILTVDPKARPTIHQILGKSLLMQ